MVQKGVFGILTQNETVFLGFLDSCPLLSRASGVPTVKDFELRHFLGPLQSPEWLPGDLDKCVAHHQDIHVASFLPQGTWILCLHLSLFSFPQHLIVQGYSSWA